MSRSSTSTGALWIALLTGPAWTTHAHAEEPVLDVQFAGALEFTEDGTLFVGDNHGGAIYAFETPGEPSTHPTTPGSVAHIDARIASLLGVGVGAVQLNDLAVHPISNEVYISVTRIGNFVSQPAIVVVSPDEQLRLLDMGALPFRKVALTELPDPETTFAVRGSGRNPSLTRDTAKGELAIRSLAIMDMEYHAGELFVAGVAHEDFRSTLRRIAVPFDGKQSIASVNMYHIAHDQYESRAPIRAMSVQEVDGEPQLVAAYTCSPVVLVPLRDIKDGARVTARTIIDMGNGQPLDMVPFETNGQAALFVTSNGRSPQVIKVSDLDGAKGVTHDDFERGTKLDLNPVMPFGPAGKPVMFDGVPLHIDRLGDRFFVSVTRDAYTGSLNLDVNPTFFPNRVHNFFAEKDFPNFDPAIAKPW